MCGRTHASQSESAGRLQQPLLVLHHSVRAGPEPQRAARARLRTSARFGGALRRSCFERHQSGPLGPRSSGRFAVRRSAACDSARDPGSPACASARVEPMDWSANCSSSSRQEPRIARHVHLPLQSGSDAVLKRMFRKYRTRHYATVSKLLAG